MGMKIAHLDWHTDIRTAVADATKRGRPILSLRLLGRLDEEYSCANSRYFRTLLYPDAAVQKVMREFVLHWQSLRPVPKVTIDFGGGRTLVRTITGNSLHAVLRSDGTPVDAVLGLLSTDAFVGALRRAQPMATGADLAKKHREALANPPSIPKVEVAPNRAFDASKMAATKHMVESPILAQLRKLKESLAEDTRTNELDLHPKLHRAFAEGAPWSTADEMVDWIYERLFLMPPDDPFLGLAAYDAFSALPTHVGNG
jgi:hypothetical protein